MVFSSCQFIYNPQERYCHTCYISHNIHCAISLPALAVVEVAAAELAEGVGVPALAGLVLPIVPFPPFGPDAHLVRGPHVEGHPLDVIVRGPVHILEVLLGVRYILLVERLRLVLDYAQPPLLHCVMRNGFVIVTMF